MIPTHSCFLYFYWSNLYLLIRELLSFYAIPLFYPPVTNPDRALLRFPRPGNDNWSAWALAEGPMTSPIEFPAVC